MEAFKVLITIAILSSCQNQETSTIKHETNAPVRENSVENFSESSKDYFFKSASFYDKISEEYFLDQEHPMAVKAQFWLDKITEVAKSQDPNSFANIPTPIAMVAMTQDLNANVKPHFECFENIKTFVNNPHEESPSINLIETIQSADLCNMKTAELKDVQTFIDSFDKDTKENCNEPTIKENNGEFEITLNCEKEDPTTYLNASRSKTSKYITIYSGLFTETSEEVFVGVLAHELAHYFRTHPSVQPSDEAFRYFYKVTGQEGDGKPLELAIDAPEWVLVNEYLEAEKAYREARESKEGSDQDEAYKRLQKAEAELSDAHIGQYTMEQEADQLAAEWLHELNISPKTFTEFWAHLGGNNCKKSFENNWLNEDGSIDIVSVGTLQDTHHSPCFRSFSTDLDVYNHKLKPTNGSYKGLTGVLGYDEQERAFSYEDAIKKIDEFFPPTVTDVSLGEEGVEDYSKEILETLTSVMTSPLEYKTILSLGSLNDSCYKNPTFLTLDDNLAISIDGICDRSLMNGQFFLPNSHATASLYISANSCNFESLATKIDLSNALTLDESEHTVGCLNASDKIFASAKFATKSQLEKVNSDYQLGHDYTVSVTNSAGKDIKIDVIGDKKTMADYKEKITGHILARFISGTDYNQHIKMHRDREYTAKDVVLEQNQINAVVTFKYGSIQGSFNIINSEIKDLTYN